MTTASFEVEAPAEPDPSAGLEVELLTVRFGGNTAVDNVSFSAPVGRITGLIGPNGAGKTTTFNACSGVLRPSAGRVHLFGEDITNLSVPDRGRRGLGRTFQRIDLFDSLTVAENIALGREATLAGGSTWRHLISSRAEQEDIARATEDVLDLCGLQALRSRNVGALSTGQRRLLDLARVVAGGARLLLLDEPSSGLDTAETERFGDIIEELVRDGGCGVLLVEHDIPLVMRLCDEITVLDFGQQILHGTPAEVRNSDLVRSAYLGEDADY